MNDNLGLLFRTRGILNRFRNAAQLSADKNQDEQAERDTDRRRADEERNERQRDYVETRRRDLAAFERKAGGK